MTAMACKYAKNLPKKKGVLECLTPFPTTTKWLTLISRQTRLVFESQQEDRQVPHMSLPRRDKLVPNSTRK